MGPFKVIRGGNILTYVQSLSSRNYCGRHVLFSGLPIDDYVKVFLSVRLLTGVLELVSVVASRVTLLYRYNQYQWIESIANYKSLVSLLSSMTPVHVQTEPLL